MTTQIALIGNLWDVVAMAPLSDAPCFEWTTEDTITVRRWGIIRNGVLLFTMPLPMTVARTAGLKLNVEFPGLVAGDDSEAST